jgi:hypothetical protein
MTEDQRGARLFRGMEVSVRLAVRRVHFEHHHAGGCRIGERYARVCVSLHLLGGERYAT